MPNRSSQKGVLVIDNGGDTIKCGFAEENDPSFVMQNCTARIRKSMHELIGDEIQTKITDTSQLLYKRPIQNGYLVDWDTESKIWKRLFNDEHLNINTRDYSLYMNDQPLNMYQIRKNTVEIVFEYYQFRSFLASPTSLWSIQRAKDLELFPTPNTVSRTYLVVDSGFSYTHILPYLDNKLVLSAVKRIDVGGKLLTNYMRDLLSHRYFDMQSNTYIVNEIKESMCYMSTDFMRDINEDIKKKTQYYVLPDYISILKGYASNDMQLLGQLSAQNAQIIPLATELFSIPEILLHPSDIGIKEAGIAEAISQCLSYFPVAVQQHLTSGILFMGGNTKFKNFQERMNVEIQSFIPSDYPTSIHYLPDPITDPWRGGASLVNNYYFDSHAVDISSYEEEGMDRLVYSIFEQPTL